MTTADDIHSLIMRLQREPGPHHFTHHDMLTIAATAGINIKLDEINWVKPYRGVPSRDFWTLWKEAKDAMKNAGFVVFKETGDFNHDLSLKAGGGWVVKYSYVPPWQPMNPDAKLPDDSEERELW